MPMTEDLGAFFDDAEFAEPVVIGGATVDAIFDIASQVVLGEVVTLAPSLLLPAASVPAVDEGTACIVRAANYLVRQVLQEPPDGAVVRLVLTRA